MSDFNVPADLALKVVTDLGDDCPISEKLLTEVLQHAISASTIDDEKQATRCRLTLVQGDLAIADGPHEPRLTALREVLTLNTENIVKLAKAVDPWAGSLAIALDGDRVVIVGFIDQGVSGNRFRVREDFDAPPHVGLLSIDVEGSSRVAVVYKSSLLGRLSNNRLQLGETHAFRSPILRERLVLFGDAATGGANSPSACLEDILCRLAIGIRFYNHGGMLIFNEAFDRGISLKHEIWYSRLRELVAAMIERGYTKSSQGDKAMTLAVTGAIRTVASLSRIDGAVAMLPTLDVVGFGAFIRDVSPPEGVRVVGRDLLLDDSVLRRVTDFGTRHQSAFSYVRAEQRALILLVSEDGHVRLVVNHDNNVYMFDDLAIFAEQE